MGIQAKGSIQHRFPTDFFKHEYASRAIGQFCFLIILHVHIYIGATKGLTLEHPFSLTTAALHIHIPYQHRDLLRPHGLKSAYGLLAFSWICMILIYCADARRSAIVKTVVEVKTWWKYANPQRAVYSFFDSREQFLASTVSEPPMMSTTPYLKTSERTT
jgi:hypothetical protein